MSNPPTALLESVSVLLAIAGSASADLYIETFENGINEGGWTYQYFEQETPLTSEGGNPAWMMRGGICCKTFPPYADTVGESIFTGDYQARNVTRLHVDLSVFALEPAWIGHALSLRLETDAGTPDDTRDDYAAYFPGDPIEHKTPPPAIDGSWRTMVYDIPSQEMMLPTGWQLVPHDRIFGFVPERATWQQLITNVSGVSFEHGPPQATGDFPGSMMLWWDFGIDNVIIECGSTVPQDIDGDGVVGPADLAQLLGAWGPCAGACVADFDDDGAVGPADLAQLLGAWA